MFNEAICYYNVDKVSNVIDYLKAYTQIPIKSIFFVTYPNVASKGDLVIENIHYNSKMFENLNTGIVFVTLPKANISQAFDKIRRVAFSLTIIRDFDVDENGPALLMEGLNKGLEDNCFLILLSMSYHNQEELYNSIIALISTQSDYKSKFSLNSQVYVLTRIDGRLQLFEIYRICKDKNLSIQKIGDVSNTAIPRKFIWDNRKDLQQCPLRVAYMDYPPYLTSSSTDYLKNMKKEEIPQILDSQRLAIQADNLTMYGFNVQIFSILQSTLNFSIKWVRVEDRNFGTFDSNVGEWDGIVGMIKRNIIDTSILELSWTAKRDSAISYTSPVSHHKSLLYFKKPGPSLSWMTFIKVLDKGYWCTIVVFILILTILLYCIPLSSKHVEKETFSFQRLASKMLLSFSQCLRAFGGLDVNDSDEFDLNNSSRSKRILVIVLCLCGITNLYVYNAGLISHLMLQRYETPIKELGDILSYPEYKLITVDGTSNADFLKYSYDSRIRKTWIKLVKENGNISSVEEAIERMLEDDKNIYFGTSPDIEVMPSIYPCKVIRSQKSYFSRTAGYVFKKDSPYIELFNNQIIKIKENGLKTELHKTMNQDFECVDDSEKYFRAISYKDVIFMFIVLISGCILATLYSVLELLVIKYKLIHNGNSLEIHECMGTDILPSTDFEAKLRILIKHIEEELMNDCSDTEKGFQKDKVRSSRHLILEKINKFLEDNP